jgi:hypothetical protein
MAKIQNSSFTGLLLEDNNADSGATGGQIQRIEMGGKFKSLLFQPQPEDGPHPRCQESGLQTTFCPPAATAFAARYPINK